MNYKITFDKAVTKHFRKQSFKDLEITGILKYQEISRNHLPARFFVYSQELKCLRNVQRHKCARNFSSSLTVSAQVFVSPHLLTKIQFLKSLLHARTKS